MKYSTRRGSEISKKNLCTWLHILLLLFGTIFEDRGFTDCPESNSHVTYMIHIGVVWLHILLKKSYYKQSLVVFSLAIRGPLANYRKVRFKLIDRIFSEYLTCWVGSGLSGKSVTLNRKDTRSETTENSYLSNEWVNSNRTGNELLEILKFKCWAHKYKIKQSDWYQTLRS